MTRWRRTHRVGCDGRLTERARPRWAVAQRILLIAVVRRQPLSRCC